MFPIRNRRAFHTTFLLLLVAGVSPAWAEDEPELSGNVSLVSDYRFRGVSLSAEDVAIQGGIDGSYGMFYVGTWASSIESFNGAETEVDLYGGLTKDAGGVTWSVGYYGYFYPGADGSNYFEVTGAAAKQIGPVEASAGINYAPKQGHIGDRDNIYLYAGGSMALPSTPVSLEAGVGYEDGAFGDSKVDWYLGVTAEVLGVSVGARYVDTNAGSQFGTVADATVLFSISASF